MPRELIVPSVILLAMLGAAVVEDWRRRRIPNAVVVLGLMASLAWHALGPPGAWSFDRQWPGATGLWGAAVAAVASLLTLLPCYRWRMLGAGDVKLFAAVAACLGGSSGHWLHLPGTALTVMLTGGLLAVVRMVGRGVLRQVWRNVRACGHWLVRRSRARTWVAWRDTADRMPYALAIALGTTFYLVSSWNGYLTTV